MASSDFAVLRRVKLLSEYGGSVTTASDDKDGEAEADSVGYDPSQREARGTAISEALLREYGLDRTGRAGEEARAAAAAETARNKGSWQLYRILAGSHRGWVRCVSVDPSNHWFVSGSSDATIKVWNLASGELMTTFEGHTATVRAVVVDQDRPYFYSGGEDKQLRSWDLVTNQVSRHFFGHWGGVYAVAKHPKLDILVSGGRDMSVRLWDLRSARQIVELSGHTAPVLSLLCQADEPQIVSGAGDRRVRLWDVVAGRAAAILTHHQSSVRALCVHPVDWAFASASAEAVKQWQCPRGDFLRNFVDPMKQRNGPNIVHALAANANDHLVAAGENGVLTFWDWPTGHCYQQIALPLAPGSLPSEAPIYAATFDQTGHRLIVGCADKTLKILKLDVAVADDDHHPDLPYPDSDTPRLLTHR